MQRQPLHLSRPMTRPLLSRTRSGDVSAWRDLVEEYRPLLRRIARHHRLSAEDADDAVRLTWLRCVEHIDQIARPDRLRAWLVAVCRAEHPPGNQGTAEVAFSGRGGTAGGSAGSRG